jgi:hypothetical protein
MSATRKQQVTRVIVFILLGLGIAYLLNQTVWSGDSGESRGSDVVVVDVAASPRNCSLSPAGRWSSDNAWACYREDLTSPDARQAAGNVGTAAAVGWAGGGPVGAFWAGVGAALGSIPWDGTWD